MVEEASEHKKRSMSQDNDLAELASKSAKQDPAGKGTRSEDAHAGKVFFSYAQLAEGKQVLTCQARYPPRPG